MSNKKKEVKEEELTGEIDVAANRFLFSFEAYQQLPENEKRRWMALARQIEVDPHRKENVLSIVKKQYGR